MIAAKCTQCGANIQVDDTKEAGICESCGTAFITQKVINNYNTYVTNNNNFAGATINITTHDIDGLLELAKSELIMRNYANANVYLDEIKKTGLNDASVISKLFEELGVLEWAKSAWDIDKQSKETQDLLSELKLYDSQNIEVWLFMLQTSNWPLDVVSYGNKVMMLSPENRKDYYHEKVYEAYIKMEFSPEKACSELNLVSLIPYDYIIQNENLQALLFENCLKFISENSRAVIISSQDRIDVWCRQLQDNRKNDIEAKLRANDNSQGCYIATCVYGSYDCPQVWTLRRFRDYILDETWYGRLFVRCYYTISPVLVKWFGNQKWFRAFFRTYLDIIILSLNKRGVDDTQYQDKY